jgi:hypothetical protein
VSLHVHVCARALRTLAIGAVFAATVGSAPAARAQAGDKALAEELFRQGQTLMREKRYAEACPKLAESQRMDPSTGTLLNLGTCHEQEGKLASAWSEFNDALQLAQRDDRQDRVAFAQEHIAAIEPRLSRLKLELSPIGDPPGLEVRLDGKVVGRPAFGVAMPVDPGPHEIGASAPGKRPWQTTVVAAQGPASQAVVIPALTDAPAGATAGAAPASGAKSDRPPPDGKTQRIVAYALGGVGVVGLALGSVFGMQAISKNDESNQKGCTDNQCSPDAAEIRRDAQAAGTASTVAFAIGGAALAGGVVLFLTAPKARTPAATARIGTVPGGASLEVGAAW